jgi:hypothetical protein
MANENEFKIRHFRYVSPVGKLEGKYTGYKPKQAANKIFMNLQKESKADVIKFFMTEITKGRKNKTFHYKGERKKLDEPVEMKTPDGNIMKDRDSLQNQQQDEHAQSENPEIILNDSKPVEIVI